MFGWFYGRVGGKCVGSFDIMWTSGLLMPSKYITFLFLLFIYFIFILIFVPFPLFILLQFTLVPCYFFFLFFIPDKRRL